MDGMVALVTGGRIKIGFETAVSLLNNGAQVIVTTRFPKDAARRFLKEKDANDWKNRLQIQLTFTVCCRRSIDCQRILNGPQDNRKYT